jgi:hypothetical protein
MHYLKTQFCRQDLVVAVASFLPCPPSPLSPHFVAPSPISERCGCRRLLGGSVAHIGIFCRVKPGSIL